jgi:hypothetical protein
MIPLSAEAGKVACSSTLKALSILRTLASSAPLVGFSDHGAGRFNVWRAARNGACLFTNTLQVLQQQVMSN